MGRLNPIWLFLFFNTILSIDALSLAPSIDQAGPNIILMKPTGETVDELPVMEVIPDTSSTYKQVLHVINHSFVSEFLDLYPYFQSYLKAQGKIDDIEPAYLALTEVDGGYARYGFCLKTPEGVIRKPGIPYVDITAGRAMSSPNKLMSFTQLFPHEMGHIFIHELCQEDTTAFNTKSVNLHFFPIITDYSTAMNEGFAEHIENVSRVYEKNPEIIQGIRSDSMKISEASERYISGFERDIAYPFRLGYYKTTMLYWFQSYEDLNRYQKGMNGEIRYNSEVPTRGNLKDRITYRNAGLRFNNRQNRNPVQMHATEGAVAAFFSALTTSSLGFNYLDSGFYKPFLHDKSLTVKHPNVYFTPWQNQFLKYFRVFHEFVLTNNAKKSQFADFLEGYIQLYPDEKDTVIAIYEKVLGLPYTLELPPPIWILVKDYDHRMVVFDPYDAITIPVYTFDLNAAEEEDLLTLDNVGKEDARRIIDYRETNGLFNQISELNKIPDVEAESIEAILQNRMDDAYFESFMEGFQPELSLKSLIIKPVKHIMLRSLLFFTLVVVVLLVISDKHKEKRISHVIWLLIRYLFLYYLLIFTGLVLVVTMDQPVRTFLIITAILLGLVLLIFRGKPIPRLRSVVALLAMCILMAISLI